LQRAGKTSRHAGVWSTICVVNYLLKVLLKVVDHTTPHLNNISLTSLAWAAIPIRRFCLPAHPSRARRVERIFVLPREKFALSIQP
jgi:hypothetical protein